jgi:hypothetical protein
MTAFDRLETQLQELLENRLLQVLPGRKPEDRLAQRLAEAMHANLRSRPDGTNLAPNVYIIIAHPSTLTGWRARPRQLDALAEALREAGAEAGLAFASQPTLSTAADTTMSPDEVRIAASFSGENLVETQDVPTAVKPDPDPDLVPSNAFLILGGTRIIPLTQTVVNIGRRLDNQVVVDDPRVSRNHTQMRVIKGRYVIFDLESTGGLFVNGQRTSQCVLYPGDVISLAGVTLVFGQDVPSARQAAQEYPVSSVSADRTTVVIKKEKDEPE